MNTANKFKELMNKQNIKVHDATLLGKYLHIDTNKDCESVIRQALGIMGAKQIKVLNKGADGQHLDGSKFHRIVGVF